MERESLQGLLRDLHLAILGREPAPYKLAADIERPRPSGTPAVILAELLASDEFQRGVFLGQFANRRIIDSLYDHILGRTPDAVGFATFEEMLGKLGLAAGVPKIAAALLASEEYRSPRRSLRTHTPKWNRTVNGRKISHVISLGTYCMTSVYLKRAQLKRYSLPFDWIFSAPESVLHFLEDDFATFLDRQHYVSMQKGLRHRPEPGAIHAFYHAMYKTGTMFAHRDPTNDVDYRYFERAVHRFRELMAGPEAKLFVMIARPGWNAPKTFPALSAKLHQVTENSAFVCIQLKKPTGEAGCHAMKALRVIGDHTLYEFEPSSVELGAGFKEPLDDAAVMRLIRQFEIDLTSASGTTI